MAYSVRLEHLFHLVFCTTTVSLLSVAPGRRAGLGGVLKMLRAAVGHISLRAVLK